MSRTIGSRYRGRTRGWGFLWLVLLAPANAAAQPRQPLRVVATGTCPAADDVVAQLRTLFPALAAVPAGSDSGATDDDARLVEEDNGLSVTLAGAHRFFLDPSQRCHERTRFAAVFLAVTLYPPQLPEPALPTATATAPAPLEPPLTVDLQLGPTFAAAPGAEQSAVPLAVGGSARIVAGAHGRIGVTAGAALMAATLRDPRADARGLWIPLDLGARLAFGGPRVDAAAEASLVVAPVRLRGQNVMTVEDGWRVQAGARAALSGRVWLTRRVALALSAFGYGWPGAVRLDVAGTGTVGHTPRLWLGAAMALVVRIR